MSRIVKVTTVKGCTKADTSIRTEQTYALDIGTTFYPPVTKETSNFGTPDRNASLLAGLNTRSYVVEAAALSFLVGFWSGHGRFRSQ